MATEMNREAKVSIILDINKALGKVDELQSKLNKLSLKNLQSAKIDTVENISKGAEKATKKVKSLEDVLKDAEKAMSQALAKHKMDIGFTNTDEYKKLANDIKVASENLNQFKKTLKEIKGIGKNSATSKTVKNVVAEKEEEKIVTYAQALRKATDELKQMLYENQMSLTSEVKTKMQEVQDLTTAVKQEQKIMSSLDEEGVQARRNKENKQAIKEAERITKEINASKIAELKAYEQEEKQLEQDRLRRAKENAKEETRIQKEQREARERDYKVLFDKIDYEEKLKAENTKQLAQEQKVRAKANAEEEARIDKEKNDLQKRNRQSYIDWWKTTIDEQEQKQKEVEKAQIKAQKEKIKNEKELAKAQATVQKSNTFKNYQTELAKVERQAAKVYYELNRTKDIELRGKLQQDLKELTQKYAELNKESVNFRKNVGISSSRGFYDLGHNMDYFLAKFRGRVTYSLASMAESAMLNSPNDIMDIISRYQQNRVNFAQVMPDSIGNNQELMNSAMREFIQVASDYGTSVQDVVEAGRLWGRQYKDIAIVQELVRNSTKLSITDNMSLTEVNKALEATLQQYNVRLKDSNEAQQVSGKIVDTWAKLADNAVVTASDLAKANEQSAGAAYQAGVGFDYLQAMITTMSAATGKSGAEIGRSIRSMLVSMQTKKAQKFFNELGIATTELKGGVPVVRSYEKVIDDLMSKLQKYPKDASQGILAMAGGKYQYNNVMALLKNYNELQKNLATVRSSEGWADEQVALQYETLDRQIQALKADVEQLIVTLEEAGASQYLGSMIQSLREFVQALRGISPEMLSMIGTTAKWYLQFKMAQSVFGILNNSIMATSGTIGSFGSIMGALQQRTITSTTALKMMGTTVLSLGSSFAALAVILATLGGLLYSISKERNKGFYSQEAVDIAQKQKQALQDYLEVYNQYEQAKANESATEDEINDAKKRLAVSSDELRKALGDEAYERIINSKNIQQAIKDEIKAIQLKNTTEYRTLIKSKELDLKRTEAMIEQVRIRMDAEEKELEHTKEMLKQRMQLFKTSIKGMDNVALRGMFGINEMETDVEGLQRSIDQNIEELVGLSSHYVKVKQEIDELKGENNTAQSILGSEGSVVNPATGGTSKGGKQDFTNATKRIILQQSYNNLIVRGKTALTQYNNAIKELDNQEEMYGATVDSINNRYNLLIGRREQLNNYQAEIGRYKEQIIKVLDAEISKNEDLARRLEYNKDLSIEAKLANLEVNKTEYEKIKTIAQLTKELDEVNKQFEDTNTKIIEVDKNLQKFSLSMKPEDVFKRKYDDINYKYNLQGTNSFLTDSQKDQIELQRQQELYNTLAQQKLRYEQELERLGATGNQARIRAKQEELQRVTLEYEQAYSKIREIQNKELYGMITTFSSSLTDNFTQMLMQGQTFKDTMKNIWNDLCSYIIKRLMQVYVYEQLVGFLTNAISPKTPASNGNFTAEFANRNVSAGLPIERHTGGIEKAYPKMHSGGMVENGRKGVVPKLQNNEVIRTLQVGEEVNSVQDRRSNEILGAIALKAMDSKNEQPQNVYITALDARTFAEYMNDNADVLMGVLAKQGALGRR